MKDSEILAPKILLLTHGTPGSQGIGELFLREIASYYPKGRLFRYSLIDTPQNDVSETWLGFHSITYSVHFSALPVISSWRQFNFTQFSSNTVASGIIGFIKENDIDMVWSILNSGYTIYLSKILIERLSIPFVFTVWDTPEHIAKNQHLDGYTKRSMLRNFKFVLQKGRRVAVASEGMRNEFRARYGIESIVIIHGIHPSLWHKPSLKLKSEHECTIGFAGSLHCKKEWNAFLSSIRDLEGREGFNIRMRFIGRFPRFGARKGPFIDFTGVLSLPDTVTALSQTDVAYVPYWFERKRSYMARTAFPSKISAYTAAGIPILYHGPTDSSPRYFIDKYPVGLCCHSLDINDIKGILRLLLFDYDVREKAGVAQQRALKEILGLESMLQRFATLLDIDRHALLPLNPM